MLSPPCILLKCVRRYSDFLCRLRRQGEGERRGTRSRQGAKPPLSLTVLGWSHAWHPQGPIHPPTTPRATTCCTPLLLPRPAVAWWRGGSPTCSGTGPLRVPGPTARRSMHACPKTVGERGRSPLHPRHESCLAK